jgi:general secretion pathway protein D
MKTIFSSTNVVALIAAGSLLGSFTAAQAQVVNNTPSPSAVQPITTQVEIGPILDVVPVVLSDGYTINLTLIPTLTEFNGYDTPPTIPGVTVANVVSVPVILPDLTVRQVISTVNVWDGQTVVLGGGITSTVQTSKDKVPFLGDLPLFGRLFQSQSKTTTKNNLMIFVTATIVDPAGHPVHSDDELPFAQNAIPKQPEIPGQTFQPSTAAQSDSAVPDAAP